MHQQLLMGFGSVKDSRRLAHLRPEMLIEARGLITKSASLLSRSDNAKEKVGQG